MKYARMITATVALDKIEEFTRRYEQIVVPTLKPVVGFEDIYLCVNPFTGESVSITFWASEQDVIAYEKSGLAAQTIDKFRSFFTTQPIVKTYQVAVAAPGPIALAR